MLDYCIQTALHMRVKLNWKMEKKIAYIHMNAEKDAHVHNLLLYAGSVRSHGERCCQKGIYTKFANDSK